ncbi:MAG: FAD-binding oxidoreductase, partial [Candidatus Kapaibacterium sp.]
MIRPRYPQIPTRARAALWIESEYDEADEDAVFAAWNGFLESVTDMSQETWFASDARRHAELRAFRHALPSAVYERVSDAGSTKIGTDIAVPPSMFRSFFSFYHELFREHGVDYVLFGHIGDCHLHANIFANDAHTHRR